MYIFSARLNINYCHKHVYHFLKFLICLGKIYVAVDHHIGPLSEWNTINTPSGFQSHPLYWNISLVQLLQTIFSAWGHLWAVKLWSHLVTAGHLFHLMLWAAGPSRCNSLRPITIATTAKTADAASSTYPHHPPTELPMDIPILTNLPKSHPSDTVMLPLSACLRSWAIQNPVEIQFFGEIKTIADVSQNRQHRQWYIFFKPVFF